jgi:hypothetical protein
MASVEAKQQPHKWSTRRRVKLPRQHVGHALARGGSVTMRRAATCGGEVGKGEGKARRWPSKPERNRSNLDHTISKTPKAIKTKEKAATR